MSVTRHIGTRALLFTAIAGIMGSGWLFGPYFVAKMVGPAAIISWVIGGILMMLIAMTFAELSSAFPMTGGSVRFLQLSHGPLVSFTMAWIGWLSATAVAPIETMALLHYINNFIPGLMNKVGTTFVLSKFGFLIAAILMFTMVVINAVGVKFLSRVNSFIVVFKLGVPLLTIIVLFAVDWHSKNLFSHGFAPMGLKSILAALPVAGVIFSYIGYSPAIQLAGEAKNPQRSIPIAVLGALGICIVFFLLLQIVFLGALKPEAFANGWTHLSFTGDSGPFVGILLGLNIVWMVYILYSGAMIAPFGTALIYTAAASRICYAMGDNGYLFKPLMKLNKHKIPMRIIMLNYVIGLFLFLPFPTWQRMVGFLVISFIFSYAAGPLALLVLRRTLPHIKRPFKLPVPRLFCLLAFYVSNLIVYWTGWSIISKMIVGICLGYIVLAIFKLTSEGQQLKLEWKTSWWVFLYIIFIGLISYLGAFGPVKLVPFGWDFLVIGIGSWIIYELALNFYVKEIDDPVINP